jgi:metal-responsive CopG/Arc/MetJ family transcriptional regulator
MGRPPLKSPRKQYTVMLEPEMVEEIDRIANKVGISRSQLMKNMIQVGLDAAKVYESTGVLLMGNAIEPFHDHRNGATL